MHRQPGAQVSPFCLHPCCFVVHMFFLQLHPLVSCHLCFLSSWYFHWYPTEMYSCLLTFPVMLFCVKLVLNSIEPSTVYRGPKQFSAIVLGLCEKAIDNSHHACTQTSTLLSHCTFSQCCWRFLWIVELYCWSGAWIAGLIHEKVCCMIFGSTSLSESFKQVIFCIPLPITTSKKGL